MPSLSAEPEPTPTRAGWYEREVAIDYLAARENAISYKHRWLAEVRPLMTRDGWQRLSRAAGDSGGYPRATAQAHRWEVNVSVACQHNPDAGPATATQVTLVCELTDRTTNGGGVPIPITDLPAGWPYDGPQPPALLDLREVGGRWLVDADYTGEAG